MADGLDGIDKEVEQHLAQQLFIGLDGERVANSLDPEMLLLDVVAECADDFLAGGGEGDLGATDFARAGIIDEFRELVGDFVGFIHDDFGLHANLGSGVRKARNQLGLPADEIQRIAGFMGEAGGCEIQFLEVGVEFAGPDEADLQVGRAAGIAPRQTGTQGGNAGKKRDDAAQPPVGVVCRPATLGGHGEHQTVKLPFGGEVFKFRFGHPAHPRRTVAAAARTIAF